MVSLIIIGILLLSFRMGAKKGLLITMMNFIGYGLVLFLALFTAGAFSRVISHFFQLTGTNGISLTFCKLLAFWTIMIISGVLFRMATRTVNFVTKLPVISQINALAGGMLAFIFTYVLMFFLLLLMANVPSENMNRAVENSIVANAIVKKTPLLTDNFK